MSEEKLQGNDSPIFKLDNDTLRIVVGFLLPCDLCQLSQTTKRIEWSTVLEPLWEFLVRRRWNVHERTKKNLSAATWKQAFQILHSRKQTPEGKFSGKLSYVFANGTDPKVASSWVMMSHGNNASLRSSEINGSTWNIAEIRLCLQNLSSSRISFTFQRHSVRIVAFHSDELDNDEISTANFRPIAVNGKLTSDVNMERIMSPSAPSTIILNPLDFAVFSFSALCPLSVSNEPDFLTMIEHFEVHVQCYNDSTGDYDVTRTITLSMISDTTIWNMYSTLPSGVVLLKDRPMISAV